jgi:NADPH:quinone reductase-like Zn-dependent oxidoreductase
MVAGARFELWKRPLTVAFLLTSGVIRVPIAATYRLTAFHEAVAHVQRGGKVVFDIGE